MEIKILWNDYAISHLEEIYDYFKIKANQSIAKKIIKSLIKETLILRANPLLGTKEPLLEGKAFEYRFLVKNNYKIIYRFDDTCILIIAVFDCRQNPNKIKSIKE